MPKKPTLAERQRNLRMRNSAPRPKMTRNQALDALADQIDRLPNGPEKAALLARYLGVKGRRRITQVKLTHVSPNSPKPKPDQDADKTEDEPARLTEEQLDESLAVPSVCVRCKTAYQWTGENDSTLCGSCFSKWIGDNRVIAEQQRAQGVA